MQIIVDVFEALLKDEVELKKNIKSAVQPFFYTKFVYNIPLVKSYFITQFKDAAKRAITMELVLLFPFVQLDDIMVAMEYQDIRHLLETRYYNYEDYL